MVSVQSVRADLGFLKNLMYLNVELLSDLSNLLCWQIIAVRW